MNIDKYTHSKSFPLTRVYYDFLKNNKKVECENYMFIKDSLEETIIENESFFGIQTGLSKYDFNYKNIRMHKNDNFYFGTKGVIRDKNLIYKLVLTKDSDKTIFDGSYLSYISNNNKIITISRAPQWWGPSEETSLIFSNQARPIPSVIFENNLPAVTPIFKFLGSFNYKFFLGTLESKREIPRAKIIGARVDFYPSDNFNISFSRTAQFGGKNRPDDLKTIFNIIIGRDNIGQNNIDQSNEPSNQLAAIDFSYLYGKNNSQRSYAQFAGEDESGYLPSRIFYNIGHSIKFSEKTISKVTIDLTNTNSMSGLENYTYSHNTYTDGYRYLDYPIGASIDSDSKRVVLIFDIPASFHKYYKIKIYNSKINENNNKLNYLSDTSEDLKGINFIIYKKYKSIDIYLNTHFFKINNDTKQSYSFMIQKRF